MAAALIVDQDRGTCDQLIACARAHRWSVHTAGSSREAIAALACREFDVVFADPRVADLRPGAPLLDEIDRRHPGTAIVVLVPRGFSEPNPDGIGPHQYLVKPLEPDQVERCVARLDESSPEAWQRTAGDSSDPPLLLESTEPAMRRAIATAREVAITDLPVLLVGERGTGKRKLAAAIHSWSGRRARPLVTMRCPTLVDRLLESGLFGDAGSNARDTQNETSRRLHAARGGTLLLDDFDALPGDLQGRLLRVLLRDWLAHREREGTGATDAQPRIIVASTRAPDVDPRNRSHVVTIVLPPLRERRADLPELIDFVVAKLRTRHGRPSLRLSPEARRKLSAHSWPGNLRELVDAVEHAVVLAPGSTITPADLPERIGASADTTTRTREGSGEGSLERFEREQIARAIATSSSLQEAAARLRINPTTLWRKRKRYGLA